MFAVDQLPYVKLLRQPAISLLWLGQVSSTMGDRLYMMAVSWLVLQWTGSAQVMSWVTLAETLPATILGLFAGALLDRVDRLRALLWIDWIRAGLTALLPVLWHFQGLSPWTLALAGALLGSLGIFFDPGLHAAVTDLVEPEYLGAINGLLDTTVRLGRTIGPSLAPLLLAFMPMVHFFTVDALSFVVSALCLQLIVRRSGRAAPVPLPSPGEPRSLLHEALDGVRIAFRHPFLRWGLIVRGMCNLVWPAFTLGIPLLANNVFHGDPRLFGLMLAAYTASTLICNVILGNLKVPSSLVLFCLAWVWIGSGFAGMGLAPTPLLAVAAAVWAGMPSPILHMTLDSYVARVLPRHERARYFSLQQVVLIGAGTLGLPVMGVLMGAYGPRLGLVAAGLVMAAIAVSGMLAISAANPIGVQSTSPVK